MRTVAFIGSDKNAGKTTAMNFVLSRWRKSIFRSPVGVTSIGLNGEEIDNYDGNGKPIINLHSGDIFISTPERLEYKNGTYRVLEHLSPPLYKKSYLVCKALVPFHITLEGPNDKEDIHKLKQTLNKKHKVKTLLIDGSIDRQFLACPTISDKFFFSILCSSRKEQINKAQGLLNSLSLRTCSMRMRRRVKKYKKDDTKSLLLNDRYEIIHTGTTPPSFDDELISEIEKIDRGILYINGALTKSLYKRFVKKRGLSMVLDNFTLFQSVSTQKTEEIKKTTLLHPVTIKALFIKEEVPFNLTAPKQTPLYNLFKDDLDGMAI